MYHYIKGILTHTGENLVVVEANGVGYELCVSAPSISKLGKIGDVCKVYCYLNVKEDEMSLYGFADLPEKDFFMKLINVSGIGCKMAISILNSGSMSDILCAIAAADLTKLSKIKGIGKKTAERIIVELRDKISPGAESFLSASAGFTVSGANSEAIEALMSLGYTRQEAQAVVSKVEKPNMTTEQIVLAALKG